MFLLSLTLSPFSASGVQKGLDSVLPDLVLLSGKIITVDENFRIAEAVAIKGNKIVAVGSDAEIRELIGPRTTVIELNGGSVLPGFEDSHIHLQSTATMMGGVNVHPDVAPDIDAFVERVAERVKRLSPGDWIIGRGWDQDKMGWIKYPEREIKWPTRWDLDKVSPNNPVFLTRICGHAAVANSKALEMAGITKDTPQPKGGEIQKDTKTGEPTGVLFEHAMDLVVYIIPAKELQCTYDDLQAIFERALAAGITYVQEAAAGPRELALYEEALRRGELPIRVGLMMSEGQVELKKLRISSPFGNEWLRINGFKFFSDGALGARTAALREPYTDKPDTKGILIYSLEELTDLYTEAHRLGIQCCTHAIGDAAAEMVLEANRASYEALGIPVGTYRDRMEHCQILGPDIIKEMAEQGMIASIQFSFATSDGPWAENRVGPERIKYSYCWRKLLDNGVPLAGGTDSPVEDYVPLVGIQKIVTSKNLDGTPEGGYYPEEVLTVEEAIKLYTIWSAYANWQEDYLGSIEIGKLADLVVLSGDILSVPHDQIAQLEVVMTIVDGEIVYS